MNERERGSATMLTAVMAVVLIFVGAALAVVAAMVVGHRRAQAAADLAALAGAEATAWGRDGCSAAGAIAERNGAALADCAVQGPEVVVEVVVTGPRWLGQTADLTGRARAGPVDSGDP